MKSEVREVVDRSEIGESGGSPFEASGGELPQSHFTSSSSSSCLHPSIFFLFSFLSSIYKIL